MNGCHVSSCLPVDGPITGEAFKRQSTVSSLRIPWFDLVSLCQSVHDSEKGCCNKQFFMRIRFLQSLARRLFCFMVVSVRFSVI